MLFGSGSARDVAPGDSADAHADVEGADQYSASTSAVGMLACVRWAQSKGWDGRWAIAVCADATETGAAAVAALVGRNAPLAVFCDMSHPQLHKPIRRLMQTSSLGTL